MPRSSYPQTRTPLPPDSGTGKMSRLFAEVRWFLLLAICLGLFAVLVTYTKSDPAWSHASFETPKNIGGRMGAWTADLMFYVFGASAFWWVILFARRVISQWRELWSVPLPPDPNIKPESLLTRWLGFALTLVCSMGLESIRLHSLQWELPRPPGGILGEVIGDPLQMAFGFTGSTLILLFGLAVGLSLFLHFSWLSLSEQVGRYIELGIRRLREKREKQEDLKIGEQAAVEREEHVEEVRIREEVAPKVQIF
ncbi:MAG: DNA translocase FtsK, partial [Burkholderiaceae bacterium]|nr:DNA translocase FtsK [Burkholderiaceae bacterium]